MACPRNSISIFVCPDCNCCGCAELVGPNDGGGINASQADPTGGVSNILQVPPDGAAPAAQPQVILGEQDHHLPMSNVIRIMRSVLPMHAKTSDDAKDTIQECASEYISFITSEANERCKREHRMTITAEDVIWAMGRLGFEHYVAPLSLYLQRYRENEGDLRSGLYSEDFPIIKHRHRPPITDNVSAPVHHAQTLQIRSSMPPPPLPLPPPPSSSLDVPPSAPPHQPSL